VLWLSG